MTSRILKVAPALGVIVLSGCSAMYSGYSVKPLSAGLDSSYSRLVTELQRAPEKGNAIVQSSCFAATVASAETTSCTNQRNQAISALVLGSAELCLAHRRSMYGNEALWNISFGTLTNVFAGAASVIHTEKYRPVLAALAVLSNSERSLVNETVYKQMLVTAVDKKILEMREGREQKILSSLALPIDKYPVYTALNDVVAMHTSCSFIDGLQKALEEGTQGTSAQKIMRLRATWISLTAELAGMSDKQSVPAKALEERIKAVATALTAEEIR